MPKKKLKIISIIIAFLLCFPIHYIYDIFPNFITSIFAPVNESIWEHMKMLFTSILLAGIIKKIYITSKKIKYNNICISDFIGAILSIPIFLAMFLPIYYFIGENLHISIIIMLITIIISETIVYKIMNEPEYKLEKHTILFIVGIYILFSILTYYPPNINIFIDPTTSTTGTQK